jgi:hypothetical protein
MREGDLTYGLFPDLDNKAIAAVPQTYLSCRIRFQRLRWRSDFLNWKPELDTVVSAQYARKMSI